MDAVWRLQLFLLKQPPHLSTKSTATQWEAQLGLSAVRLSFVEKRRQKMLYAKSHCGLLLR